MTGIFLHRWLNRLPSLFKLANASFLFVVFFGKGLLNRAKEFFAIVCSIGTLRFLSTSFTYLLYCSVPSFSMPFIVASIASLEQFRVSRIRSSGQSSKKGFPMLDITSDRLLACLLKASWSEVCAHDVDYHGHSIPETGSQIQLAVVPAQDLQSSTF